MTDCKWADHIFPDVPDRASMSEEYYDCQVEGCNYTDRRTK